MSDWQRDILDWLKKYSGHKVSHDEGTLTVLCDNPESDDVSIWGEGNCYLVSFGSWHEHFDNVEDAMSCFKFCLVEKCRLKVTLRGDKEYAWTLQTQEPEGWEDGPMTGLIFIPFWKPKRFEFRHNELPLRT